MIKSVFFCTLYALLNVTGAALIKLKLKGTMLGKFDEWLKFLFDAQVILSFVLIFVSALVLFKALSSGSFSQIIPIATGINFMLTVIMGIYLFKDKMDFKSYIGFVFILAGIILLSLNTNQNGQHE